MNKKWIQVISATIIRLVIWYRWPLTEVNETDYSSKTQSVHVIICDISPHQSNAIRPEILGNVRALS